MMVTLTGGRLALVEDVRPMSAFRVKANVGNWRCFDIADRSLLVGAVDAAMVRIGGRSVNRLRQCSFLVGNIPRARGYV